MTSLPLSNDSDPFVGECERCGWTGPDRRDPGQATHDADTHRCASDAPLPNSSSPQPYVLHLCPPCAAGDESGEYVLGCAFCDVGLHPHQELYALRLQPLSEVTDLVAAFSTKYEPEGDAS